MKAWKTFVLPALAACMLLACTACTPVLSEDTQEPVATGDGTQGDTLPTLTMATEAAFPPYEYTDGQEIVGIDIEIAGKIAQKLGMELKIENMAFADIITAVQNGAVDIGMAALTADEARLAVVNFSDSYTTGTQSILVTDKSDIDAAADLAGKKLGVLQNTAGAIYVAEEFGDAAVSRLETGASALSALLGGSVDAIVLDNVRAKALAQTDEALQLLDDPYRQDNYAVAVGKDKSTLLKKVNSALAELKASGEIRAIIDRYINDELE